MNLFKMTDKIFFILILSVIRIINILKTIK